MAGELRHRVAFDRRQDVNPDAPDDLGNTQSEFVAKVQARLGGEAVTAARLTGQQPVSIIVRQSAQTKLIADDWRARDVRTGAVYAIRSIIDPDDTRAFFELLCQVGVAA
jgi:head-tail adaptor